MISSLGSAAFISLEALQLNVLLLHQSLAKSITGVTGAEWRIKMARFPDYR